MQLFAGTVEQYVEFAEHAGDSPTFRTWAQAVAADPEGLAWLERLGPKACFFAFLPLIGDPLGTVAGWLKLPFWPCFWWSAAGKFIRYVVLTAAILELWPGQILLGI